MISVIQTTYTNILRQAILGAALLGMASLAHAKDYMVEVLLFENSVPAPATENHSYTAPRQMKTGGETWDLPPSMLLSQKDALEKSSDYTVKQHYSWGQESLAYEDSATFHLFDSNAQGFIKIYAEQLLFANIDVDYNGYRMQEKRRLKLNEVHFFDHPKFGMLLQVSRLEPKEEETDASLDGE